MSELEQRWRNILLKHVTLEEQAEVLKFFAEIASLRAKLVGAEQAREIASDTAAHLSIDLTDANARANEAEKRMARLEEALRKYAVHKITCKINQLHDAPCSCGLDKAAREALAAEPVSPAACSHSPER